MIASWFLPSNVCNVLGYVGLIVWTVVVTLRVHTTRFNTRKIYIQSTECICVLYMDLRTTNNYFPIQH